MFLVRYPVSQQKNTYVLRVTGNPLNPATPTTGVLTLSAKRSLNITKAGDVQIVSITQSNDAGYIRHDIIISCVNGGSGKIFIRNAKDIVSFGNHNGAGDTSIQFYTGTNSSSPVVLWERLTENTEKVRQLTEYLTILPNALNKMLAFPKNLRNFIINGANLAINYTGSFPQSINRSLYIYSDVVNITFNGVFPQQMTGSLVLVGNNIKGQFEGALPAGITGTVQLMGNAINWVNNNPIPSNVTGVYFSGNNINWTGNALGNIGTPKPNFTILQLLNYLNPSDTMDYADLITLLTSILNNTGTLPATVVIREQIPANVTAIAAATPNENGTNAEKCKYLINTIKSTKNVTTFTLNTTNI